MARFSGMKQGRSPLHLKRPRYTRQGGAHARQEQGATDLKLDTRRQGALYTLLIGYQWAGSLSCHRPKPDSSLRRKNRLQSGSFVYPYDVKLKGGEAFLNPCHVGLAVTCRPGPIHAGLLLLFGFRRLPLLARLGSWCLVVIPVSISSPPDEDG